ncbi:uncharacterized protein BDZ99DRAFT_480357 [Mytilinidion resinicola]|uniref:Uncharacterized protein n=1 Tax=Mytilinidion resinicola TaxID=574789 RepID=A0A6A6YA32_9PEZI|nr:uncharacterized protein BDZ99DRAFT_480357 [Mytilinidion resinicola]KAF2805682.1 hypothetical protein BDZ99DRAFT_480357 [Mytilinidion resinicola]
MQCSPRTESPSPINRSFANAPTPIQPAQNGAQKSNRIQPRPPIRFMAWISHHSPRALMPGQRSSAWSDQLPKRKCGPTKEPPVTVHRIDRPGTRTPNLTPAVPNCGLLYHGPHAYHDTAPATDAQDSQEWNCLRPAVPSYQEANVPACLPVYLPCRNTAHEGLQQAEEFIGIAFLVPKGTQTSQVLHPSRASSGESRKKVT